MENFLDREKKSKWLVRTFRLEYRIWHHLGRKVELNVWERVYLQRVSDKKTIPIEGVSTLCEWIRRMMTLCDNAGGRLRVQKNWRDWETWNCLYHCPPTTSQNSALMPRDSELQRTSEVWFLCVAKKNPLHAC